MRKFAFLWLAMLPWCLYSQLDTSYKLDEFRVLAIKNYGFKNTVDSVKLALYNNKTMADLLINSSGIFIKNYGIGGLSTLSIRGGSAEQTSITWNGLSLNSPLNGVLDLNTIPVFMMGAKSNINASASGLDNSINAAGGSVELFTAGLNKRVLHIYTSYNNVGNKALGLKFGLNNKWTKYNFNAFVKNNKNHYPYINPLNNSQQIELHANNKSMDLMQEIKGKWGKNIKIKLGNWLQYNQRQIANGINTNTQQGYKNQHSYSFLSINKFNNSHKLGFDIGHRYATLNYTDTGNSIIGAHSFNEFSGKIKFKKRVSKSLLKQWYSSSEINYTLPISNGYTVGNISRLLYNMKIGTHFKLDRISANIFAKQQWQIGQYSIPQFSVSVLKKNKKHQLMMKYATLFRLPTLNEQFWGGKNSLLKPEKGYIAEAAYLLKLKQLNLKVSPYFKKIEDYINWIFINRKSQAQNVNKTQFYGIDIKADMVHIIKQFSLKSSLAYNYVNAKALVNNDFKYLIFVPKHQASYMLSAKYKNLFLSINTIYSHKVYTTNDNLSSLRGFLKSDLMLKYPVKLKLKTLSFGATIFNLFNQNYSTIPSNPNPLRHFLLTAEIIL